MRPRHLVWLRRLSQTLFFLLFIYLLIESRLPKDVSLDAAAGSADADIRLNPPVTFFFNLDPLVGLSSLLSGGALIKGFLWGLAVVLLTLFMGRVFCGFICPFGTLHHAVSWFRPSLKGNQLVKASEKTPHQKIKYFLFILLMLAALLGLNATGLLDPISFCLDPLPLPSFPDLERVCGLFLRLRPRVIWRS